MNIFVLSSDPKEAARSLHDIHLVKMILETCQLMCSAKRFLDGDRKIVMTQKVDENGKHRVRKREEYILKDAAEDMLIYKAAWINHPCSIWLRQSDKNWDWLHTYLSEITDEYTKRYGKIHTVVQSGLVSMLIKRPINIPVTETITPFAQAMPDMYKDVDAVKAYRNYYMGTKAFNRSGKFMARYRSPGVIPSWWVGYEHEYRDHI